MEITLTPAQWVSLVPLVKMGQRAQRVLELPVEIGNGDQKIEIRSGEVKITLVD